MCSKTNLAVLPLLTLLQVSTLEVAAQQHDGGEKTAQTGEVESQVRPLASKEEMIRDRFERFEDRVYRLRDSLEMGEPDNAVRLERVLRRAGELGIADRLEELVELLHDPSSLTQAADMQATWLSDIDRLLAILMERDSDNEERQAEIDRLERYEEKVNKILEQQRELRDASAQDALRKRMSEQLGNAIKRVEVLLRRQEEVSKDTRAAGESGAHDDKKPAESDDAPSTEQLSKRQESLSQDSHQLSEDLQQLGAPETPQEESDPAQADARSASQDAAESAQSASRAMSEASESLHKGDPSSASRPQEDAAQALREAKKKLEEAKSKLDRQTQPEAKADAQEKLAEETESLSDEMQQDAAPDDGEGGSKSEGSTPGQQEVEQAESEMKDASKSLGKSQAGEAKKSQDRAIEQLEQAKKELEEALSQLRTEEREETLRDLESRFREMLSKQRAINEATLRLHQIGRDNFKRPDKLELADLSAKERALSQDASTCLHILDEDGTTVAFPHVVEQLAEDMNTVAGRLADLRVGLLTQTIEQEIVDTLDQLLGAVLQMQQENEQQQGKGQSQQGGETEPLLPPSAEYKLLRASQHRVNKRTEVIEGARAEEPEQTEALLKVAKRQADCAEIAREMRDQIQHP